jgi:flagellar biosynthesis GTPase FlhF
LVLWLIRAIQKLILFLSVPRLTQTAELQVRLAVSQQFAAEYFARGHSLRDCYADIIHALAAGAHSAVVQQAAAAPDQAADLAAAEQTAAEQAAAEQAAAEQAAAEEATAEEAAAEQAASEQAAAGGTCGFRKGTRQSLRVSGGRAKLPKISPLNRVPVPAVLKVVCYSGEAQTPTGALMIGLLPPPSEVVDERCKPVFVNDLAKLVLGPASTKRKRQPVPDELAVLLAQPQGSLPRALELVRDALSDITFERLTDIAFSPRPTPGWLGGRNRASIIENAVADVMQFKDTQSSTYDALLNTELPAMGREQVQLVQLDLGDFMTGSLLPRTEVVR